VTCQAQHPKANIVLLLVPDLQYTELQAPASQRRFGYSLRYRLTRLLLWLSRYRGLSQDVE
jgi:hypothetical protein